MLIGIVSDVHGNEAALLKAMELIGDVDEWICLGDSIREYRFSNEVVSLLRKHSFITIQGNHEAIFFGRCGAKPRSAPWIDRDLMQWLGAQPSRRLLQREGKQILLVHSTPWESGDRYVCVDDSEFFRFGATSADIVLYGHTHEPVVARAGHALVVNPGSTGESRLRGDRLEMSCAVLDVTRCCAQVVSFTL
jgi:putative phosphoesterase